ncbi:MAG: hypothetical protein LBO76_03470, partial [Treponema sp.]|nr:hypothetical protein [Treponema sp.]
IGILKRTLLVVLFSLALAFFTLLMDTLLVKNREPREVPQSPAPGNSGKAPEPPRADAHEEAPDTPETAESWMPPDDDDEDDMPDFDGDGDEAPGFDFNGGGDEPDFDADDEAPDFDDGPAPQERAAPQESAAPGERAAGDTPQGLFSPRGGIGWNAYTEERLESELHRCASTEQDLALILAEIKEPENIKAELFRLFCQEAVLYFEHRDLIFENGDQGIAVICPGFGLEQAFTKSEEFNNRVLGKLAQASGAKTDLRFGISSRAGRLIDAGRIALEAGEALKRASGDPASHIVAFKSDPEKYRQHVAGRRP